MQHFSTLTEKQGAIVAGWYRQHGRDLPWRHTRDAYAIWLSEVVLQQTRVQQGAAYWHRLLEAFPTVHHLAAANEQTVLKTWEGLGYYSRARNLHKAAQAVVQQYGGVFPANAQALQQLPGIGPYTARAVASLAWGERTAVLDGNVFRVLARFGADDTPIDKPASRTHYQALADAWLGTETDPADFNQGMMDLGAMVCTPRNPACSICPLNTGCQARQLGTPHEYPRKATQPSRRQQYWEVYFAPNANGAWPLTMRSGKGVWHGLWFLPHQVVNVFLPVPPGVALLGYFQHEFSHYRLNGRVLHTTPDWLAEHQPSTLDRTEWLPQATVAERPKPRAWVKVLQLVQQPAPELFV
jgi:A/G-specific adenine glycosylase